MTALFDDPGFRTGLAVGIALAALLGTVTAVIRSQARSLPFPLAGVAVAIGGLIAQRFVPSEQALSGAAQQAIVLAIVGGVFVSGARTRRPALTALAYLPAGIRLALGPTIDGAPGWAGVAATLVAVGGGVAIADFDRRHRPLGVAPALVAVGVAGAYSTLPDTEHVVVLLGVALPLAAVGIPRAWEAIGSAGAGAIATWFGWVVWVDGRGRAGSIVGAVAALAILIGEPVAHRLGPFPGWRLPAQLPKPAMAAMVCAAQVGLALAAGRIAGLQESAVVAGVLALPVVALAGALGLVLARTPPPPARNRWQDDRYRR